MNFDGEHPTVLVDDVPIDEDIAPLIEALWQRGIETLNSCQDNGETHRVWIEFASPADASQFLNSVVGRPGNERTLYGRAMGTIMDTPDGWTYAVVPWNYGIEESIVGDEMRERRIGPNDVDFFVSIRFPRRDLASVVHRLLTSEGPLVEQRRASDVGFSTGARRLHHRRSGRRRIYRNAPAGRKRPSTNFRDRDR